MEKTRIDWCDSSWNPVTGCLHGCRYCYARGIATRFGGWTDSDGDTHHDTVLKSDSPVRVLDKQLGVMRENGDFAKAPYPYDFIPTLHRYKLDEYQKKKGRNIFVCSMADLFGSWVPHEWQQEVFEACKKAPQHNYLFLTKNPAMYNLLDLRGELPADSNMWYGTTVTRPSDKFPFDGDIKHNLFLSIEPLLADFGQANAEALRDIGWVIIGAENGNRKGKVIPERSWVENLVEQCRKYNIPVFMKSSLTEIWGEPLIQEFPERLKR